MSVCVVYVLYVHVYVCDVHVINGSTMCGMNLVCVCYTNGLNVGCVWRFLSCILCMVCGVHLHCMCEVCYMCGVSVMEVLCMFGVFLLCVCYICCVWCSCVCMLHV